MVVLISGASGSGELVKTLNGAKALHNTSAAIESIENETITWNWNPQASSKLSIEQNRRRSTNSGTDEGANLASGSSATGKNLSVWSHNDTDTGTDVKNSHFWSKVLFNNNTTTTNTNNGLPPASNTAVIFNNIISNLKDHQPKIDMDAIDRNFNLSNALVQNAGDGNATAAAGSGAVSMPFHGFDATSKSSSQKQKIVKNRLDRKNETNHYAPLDNDLNVANSTFLRALNDLHLDYNDLTGATNAMVNRQEHSESTAAQSKERFDFKSN